MNEWNYDATCTITAFPVFDLENCKRFVFSIPWTNIHSLHRTMKTRIFTIMCDNHEITHYLFERYYVEEAAKPVERIQRCGQLIINTHFQTCEKTNERLSQNIPEYRWRTMYYLKTAYMPTWVTKSQTREDYCAVKGQDITNHLHSRSQFLAVNPNQDSAKVLWLFDQINCINRIQFIQKKPQYSCGRPLITQQ